MGRFELMQRPDLAWPFRGFFSDFDHAFREAAPLTARNTPAVDIQEKDDHYIVKADLPGYEKSEVNIHLEDGILTLSAHHNEETNEEKDSYLRQERRISSFRRSFLFEKAIDAENVKAELKDGVLTLALPQTAPKPSGRKIELE